MFAYSKVFLLNHYWAFLSLFLFFLFTVAGGDTDEVAGVCVGTGALLGSELPPKQQRQKQIVRRKIVEKIKICPTIIAFSLRTAK